MKRLLLRSSIAALAAAAALLLPSAAAAAPASTSFRVVGYEYAFTSTVGSFAGTATGNAADVGGWNATVQHDPLGSSPTYVDGGTFQLGTAGLSDGTDSVTGTLDYHGGTITTLNPGAGCTNQQFLVTDTIGNVSTETTSGGSGSLSVVLTHFRTSIFGHCVIYSARVAGTVSFVY
jgi:hypothetical protein